MIRFLVMLFYPSLSVTFLMLHCLKCCVIAFFVCDALYRTWCPECDHVFMSKRHTGTTAVVAFNTCYCYCNLEMFQRVATLRDSFLFCKATICDYYTVVHANNILMMSCETCTFIFHVFYMLAVHAVAVDLN